MYACTQKRAPDPITDSCEPPCACWKLNSRPLEEQSVLLNTEPSLQPQALFLNKTFQDNPRSCSYDYRLLKLHLFSWHLIPFVLYEGSSTLRIGGFQAFLLLQIIPQTFLLCQSSVIRMTGVCSWDLRIFILPKRTKIKVSSEQLNKMSLRNEDV